MTLTELDQTIFLRINSEMQSPLGDTVIPYFREMMFWLPLYVFLLFYFILNYKKQAIYILLAIGMTIFLCDFISSGIFKPLIGRLRPCADPVFGAYVHRLTGCGGYSMPSSHATNHFGIATFLSLFFYDKRWVNIALMMWASIISLSQIYVGLHYPSDILCGMIMGIGIGTCVYTYYAMIFKINTWK